MKLCTFVFAGLFSLAAFGQAPAVSTLKKLSKDTDREIKLGEDEAGCKDSALLPRVPGCSIIQCDAREVDSVEMQVGVSTEGVVQIEGMDGPSEVIYYLCPAKVSLGQITKVSEAALVKSGFKTVYSGKDEDDQPLVTVLKDTQWLQISTYRYNDYSAYIQAAVKVTPESQASSEAMSEEMTKSGRVVLYGILFEQQKTVLPAEADKILAEVAAFLVRQPALKVRVEGHSADGADATENVSLSKQRASAVATWLLDHGIDKTRLTIDGVGDSKPDVGGDKSKNLRIELVRL
jgi:outer membrane protein OmpA-like peptidoglycan-associated protein